MERTRYESRVEEARSIKQRSRRDQVRLMLLVKEAQMDDVLDMFLPDIGVSQARASAYLHAWDHLVELGIVNIFTDADMEISPLVYEVWGDVYEYDYTTSDPRDRYKNVDVASVRDAAEELELKGFKEAVRIARQPNSMRAAIIGNRPSTQAAIEAVFTAIRDKDNEDLRKSVQDQMLDLWKDEGRTTVCHGKLTVDERWSKIWDSMHSSIQRAYDFDIPEHLIDLSLARARRDRELVDRVITVLEGRRSLDSLSERA